MRIFKLFSLFFLLLIGDLLASPWTSWTESPNDPIYNPYPVTDGEDYWPYVVYNANQFDGNGDAALYKMWHQGSNVNGSIAISYSNDGVNWTLKGETNLTPAYHAVVLYDKNGFSASSSPGKPYRIWYWIGAPSSTDPGVIQFSQSNDGINWDAPQPITQDSGSPLVDSTSFYFFQLYGPGFVIYNPAPTSTAGQPYTFPFVMFYDTATLTQTTIAESIALAYSMDGKFWTRFGSLPVLIPSGNIATDWDATHIYRPSVIFTEGMYHMFYSGSNQYVDPLTTIPYAHGIGHASSTDGINWTKDASNPIFIYSNGVPWRNTRTYTPFVLFSPFCDAGSCPGCVSQMWLTGGTGLVTGENQGIGYATLPCPPKPPLPPTKFRGCIHRCCCCKSKLMLKAKWHASLSPGVVSYRIYKRNAIFKVVPATSDLFFKTCLKNIRSAKAFSITAVNESDLESPHLKLKIVCQ